jgi:hypothetical protein
MTTVAEGGNKSIASDRIFYIYGYVMDQLVLQLFVNIRLN